jgi:hypothetical protein
MSYMAAISLSGSSACLSRNRSMRSQGRFVSFLYIDDNVVVGVKRGRTLMFKNGVCNEMVGCDGSIEMTPGLTEETMGQIR